jgi:phospholipid/cholesterol/gamma-HCH transport system ATP-binding protein
LELESRICKRSDPTITTKNAEGILILQVLKRKQKDATTEFWMKSDNKTIEADEILSFRGVSVAVPPPYEFGLEDVNLVLKRGELALISVERGHGLSPLADTAQGLIVPDQGGVYFLGKNWIDLSPAAAAASRQMIGRVFRGGGWISNLNIDENITLGQRHHSHKPIDEIYQEAEKLGIFFGLKSLPGSRPAHVRRSLLRRSGWVRAFLGDPELILLEEPLKDAYTDVLHYLMKGIAEALARGAAILWITSDMRILDQSGLAPFKIYRMTGPRLEPLELTYDKFQAPNSKAQ